LTMLTGRERYTKRVRRRSTVDLVPPVAEA
jgi:hypothetical protein